MKKKYLVHVIWLAVAIIAFAGGMYYGKSTASSSLAGRTGSFASSTRSGFGGRGNAGGGGFVTGQIVSKDAQSLTVRLPNGNSEIVFYSSSTSVIKPSPASVSDLTTGTNVVIGGTQNTDGSVTAQTIQVRQPGVPGGGGPNGQ
ncbi:MAG: hypothetical protein ABSC29_02760 [Minisyncoccia bacterium]|jgi:hypothetical protein